MASNNEFNVQFKNFEVGFSPTAHLDSLTERGNSGSASVMTDVDILDGLLTQGPGLEALTNGTEAGVVTELINYILDTPAADSITYGIGTSKLFKITPTTVTTGGSPSWPQAITGCTEGESVARLGANIYGFYNKASGGDILKMPIGNETIDPDWGSTTPTGFAALQSAAHPVAVKEDIMAFGNGRYLGFYTEDNNTIQPTKLDFGTACEVADVAFHANYWYVAVNGSVSGTNRTQGQIFIYDGAVVDTLLADELGVGFQRIGFIYVLDGVMYVAYQDLSDTNGYHIGYLNGRKITPLASFTGGLPTYQQKTLYRHTILFNAAGSLWSCGAVSPEFPVQISQIADGGYATVGAVAAPFGTPMVASYSGSTYQLAKFSGYSTTGVWKSVVIPTTTGNLRGYIDTISVLTRTLGADATATLVVEANQGNVTSNSKAITGTGKTRFSFSGLGLGASAIEDFRIYISFSSGDTSNPVKIRDISVYGHYVES